LTRYKWLLELNEESSVLEGSCGEDGNRASEVVVGQVPGHQPTASQVTDSAHKIEQETKRNKGKIFRAYRKESWGILASDAGNAPDKLLLFSLLRQKRRQHKWKHI
jgi:hypothetical protein